MAKYNQPFRIEEELDDKACFPGLRASKEKQYNTITII